MPHKSFYVISVHTIKLSAQFLSLAIYGYMAAPVSPASSITPTKSARNEIIRQRAASGETYAKIAADYGLSENRVYQIVNHRRK
jgi:hypothetical protein